MSLLSECHVFGMKWCWCYELVECVSYVMYEVRLMWWCCWVSVVSLYMKSGWCDEVWWVSVICLYMRWGYSDDVDEWVSCVCVWSDDDVMMLLSDCHAFVYEVRMMWLCWRVIVVCLCRNWGWCDDVVEWVLCVSVGSEDDIMKWGWCDDVVEWVLCVCVWSEDDVMMLLI